MRQTSLNVTAGSERNACEKRANGSSMPYVPMRNPPFDTPSMSPCLSGPTIARIALSPPGFRVVTRQGHSVNQSHESEFAPPREPPRPIVQGRDLVARGMKPGPAFGPILEACYEAQLAGEIKDPATGAAFLDALLAARPAEP